MQTHPRANTPIAAAAEVEAALVMRVRAEPSGVALATEAIANRDLVDATAELWQAAYLRRGRTDVGLGEVRAQLRLVHRDGGEAGRHCAGFELEATRPAGVDTRLFFARECLDFVAARSARRLVDEGALGASSIYYYELGLAGDSKHSLSSGSDASVVSVRGPEGRGAPDLRHLPIRFLRERVAGPTPEQGAGHYPVFVTRAACERAESISRKGADANPPVETGGLLIGPLCVCPDTGEMFAVICDVLEATDSEATTYSLSYSGPTWARIQNILRARQANPATQHHRILGQAHGHNFLPADGAPPCEWCHLQPQCTRTSAHLSPEDRIWCRAVFNAEPWQLSIVYGLDAQARPDAAFYGQRGGVLALRSNAIVDGFDEIPSETGV